MSEIEKIADALKENRTFLVTAHDSPCGDAIASGLALSSILRRTGKEVLLLNCDRPPPNLAFLPGADRIETTPPERPDCDAAVVLDCANAGRIGCNKAILEHFGLVINIDHHVSNDFFGDLNYVDPEAASTGELVFTLSKHLVDEITAEEAVCLYTTLVMDTGSFKYSNTSPRTHRLAAFFLEKGVDPAFVANEIFGNLSCANRKLLGKALSGINLSECGKVVSVKVTRKMLDESGAHEDEAQDFIDYIQSIRNAEVSFCLRELASGRIKANFRSRTIDVDRLASSFGGGGHARAAGCSFENTPIDEAERIVRSEISKFL